MYITTTIDKTGVSSDDQTDFETNYKSTINKTIDPRDTDNVSLSRVKQTTTGWTIQDHKVELSLGTLSSLYSKKDTGADFNFSTVKYYELISSAETLITGANAADQGYLTANCIKTVIDWEPTFDYDIIGGEIRFSDTITQDVRLWVTAVPDLPSSMGGSKELLTGGRNLKFIQPKSTINLDGRTAKRLSYNASYHTNKLRYAFRHDVGAAYSIEIALQFYKA
jgi:hypothetical protein